MNLRITNCMPLSTQICKMFYQLIGIVNTTMYNLFNSLSLHFIIAAFKNTAIQTYSLNIVIVYIFFSYLICKVFKLCKLVLKIK